MRVWRVGKRRERNREGEKSEWEGMRSEREREREKKTRALFLTPPCFEGGAPHTRGKCHPVLFPLPLPQWQANSSLPHPLHTRRPTA
jgi:hypothetical protein